MPVYHLAQTEIRPLPETDFAACGLKERVDIQRLLRANVSVVAPDVLVIAEEFGEWDESKRRIDLLGVDTAGNLVVIELKRDDDAHMELQAIRYAAMVSGMTFDRAVEVFQQYLNRTLPPRPGETPPDARMRLLAHLKPMESIEDGFAEDIRIVLVSSSFSKELVTAVLWLNERDLDIRCVRMKPYTMLGDSGTKAVIVDVQQVVPLPEAEDMIVKLKAKGQAERKEKAERHLLRTEFWKELIPECAKKTPMFAHIKPGDDNWISATAGWPGMRYSYVAWTDQACAELYIDRGSGWEKEIKMSFDYLHLRKDEIEKAFGGPLSWERLDTKRACRVRGPIITGGIQSPREEWPRIRREMIDSMAKLNRAMESHLATAVG
jgi:hypothetical protein